MRACQPVGRAAKLGGARDGARVRWGSMLHDGCGATRRRDACTYSAAYTEATAIHTIRAVSRSGPRACVTGRMLLTDRPAILPLEWSANATSPGESGRVTCLDAGAAAAATATTTESKTPANARLSRPRSTGSPRRNSRTHQLQAIRSSPATHNATRARTVSCAPGAPAPTRTAVAANLR